MSTFANAFSTTTNKTVTENGAVIEATTGQPVLDFSHKVLRSTPVNEITTRINDIIKYCETTNDVNALHDLFVIIFHKRNPRGGEGEKAITYQMLLDMYDHYPITIISMIHLVADFGYYKDLYQIWEKICQNIEVNMQSVTDSDKNKALMFYYNKYNPLIEEIIRYTMVQRDTDLTTINKGDTSISLLGKWIPREGSHFAKKDTWYLYNKEKMLIKKSLIDMLINYMALQSGVTLSPDRKFPAFWYQKYRKGNTLLNQKLNVPEIAMCANRYADIKFEHVASCAMAKYRKAFMNEQLKIVPKPFEEATGNRFPDKVDRVNARNNLKTILQSGASEKLKASVLEPHNIIEKLVSPTLSSMDKQLLIALWEAKKIDVKKHLAEVMEQLKAEGVDLGDLPRPGKLIPMADVSGSMMGNYNSYYGGKATDPSPLMIAVALSIMTSELHEIDSPFRDMLISFTDIPQNFKFRPEQDLLERYQEITKRVGYNTNFRLAIEELLKLCIKNSVKEEDIPDLIVFTDGQFNAWGSYNSNSLPNQGWTTHFQQLSKLWAKAGYTKIPRIIFWNLRGDTPGVQTDALHPGVQMLQGFSPNLLKFVLMGEKYEDTIKIVEVDGKKVEMKVSSVTPWETFRNIVEQSRYDVIRVMLSNSNEKLLKNYNYIAPVTNISSATTQTESKDTNTTNTTIIEIIDDDTYEKISMPVDTDGYQMV